MHGHVNVKFSTFLKILKIIFNFLLFTVIIWIGNCQINDGIPPK
jgi:hypothetical protein